MKSYARSYDYDRFRPDVNRLVAALLATSILLSQTLPTYAAATGADKQAAQELEAKTASLESKLGGASDSKPESSDKEGSPDTSGLSPSDSTGSTSDTPEQAPKLELLPVSGAQTEESVPTLPDSDSKVTSTESKNEDATEKSTLETKEKESKSKKSRSRSSRSSKTEAEDKDQTKSSSKKKAKPERKSRTKSSSKSKDSKNTDESPETSNEENGSESISSGDTQKSTARDSKKKKKEKKKSRRSKKEKIEEEKDSEPQDDAVGSDSESETPAMAEPNLNKPDKAADGESGSNEEETSADSEESTDQAQSDEATSEEVQEQVSKPKRKRPVSTVEDEVEALDVERKSSVDVEHISEADQLLLKHKYKEAEEAYRGLISSDDTGDVYAGLAVALAKQHLPKKILEAQKVLRKGMQEFPGNPNMQAAGALVSYYHSHSVASPAKRDLYLEAAEKLSKRAIVENPDIVIAQQTLGLVRLEQDDAEGAIKPLKVAAEIAQDPENMTLLAKALLKVDPRDEEAGRLVDEALEMNVNYHPARLQKAYLLTNMGNHEDAFTELHTIPSTDRDSDWQSVQGDVFRKQGDGPSALASWKEANRLNPRNPDPYKRLAEYYAMRGDGELAISEMHNALEILPNDMNLRGRLAELALRLGKLDVADQEYRTILEVKPDDPTSLLGLARVGFQKARKEGQYPQDHQQIMDKLQDVIMEQSISVKGKMLKNGMRDLKEKIQLSEAEKALTQNRFREARQLFNQVITQHKEQPYELLTLGEQCFNDGDLSSAQLAYTYAKELSEVAPRAEQGISKIVTQRNEAKRQVKLGNATEKLPEVAIDHYRQALIVDPQHPPAFFGLYKMLSRTKKDDEKAIDYATSFLEAAEDSNPLRNEVEDDLSKLKKRVEKQK